MSVKGTWHRPHDHKKYAENWKRIFGKKRKTKHYDLSLDIVHSLAGWGAIGYYSKGHHDLAEFIEACIAEFGEEDNMEVVHRDNVIQEHWRKVRASEEDGAEDTYAYKFLKSEPGPGAFPVTHIELESWSR